MTSIKRTIELKLTARNAFEKFVHELNEWWPKEYTWSQDKLQNIHIDARKEGLCTELGPHGFRCDWGRVTAIEPPESITFKWQIGPRREPVPDPSKASEVEIRFKSKAEHRTEMVFEHRDFKKHGEGAEAYQQAMDSERGWDYILNLYLEFVRQQP